MPEPSAENTSVVRILTAIARSRDVDTVPFVEMFQGRLQGVVSSGSDVERVYCAFCESGSFDYYSSTNNNRPDAGMAKRIDWLCTEAVAQFGIERVLRFLQLEEEKLPPTGRGVGGAVVRRGSRKQEPANTVFSRFLSYLRHLELKAGSGPVPEMAWFVGP
jgi:hypothetical protein